MGFDAGLLGLFKSMINGDFQDLGWSPLYQIILHSVCNICTAIAFFVLEEEILCKNPHMVLEIRII